MKLGLIGKNISHSRSPAIYQKLLGNCLQYDLLDVPDHDSLPSLELLAKSYQGINITSPYKTAYLSQVVINDSAVKHLGSINTLKFDEKGVSATNTDLIAVRAILQNLILRFSKIHLILLGSGVMANLTQILAAENSLSVDQLSRRTQSNLSKLDLSPFEKMGHQNVVINACAREFVFSGEISSESIFWDYNYNFIPHQNTLPFKVKEYHDGQEMLFLQAEAALEFWNLN